jgi:flagellar L-ring protein precursor FlgH
LSLFAPTDASMGGNSAFQGAGQTAQGNSLVGEISVTVAEVLPNGSMVVRGEKQLRINRGNESIRVSGIVRPADVGPDNRVASTRLADARIDYVGRGEIARASRQGWLQRFFTMISPF